MIYLLIPIAFIILLAINHIRYMNKIKRRIQRHEHDQRFNKPNWTKWWDR